MTYKINEDLYIGNTNKQLKDLLVSDGDTLPIGSIIPYGSSTTPSNWLKCDGSAVSRTTYSELFSVIGTLYGSGDGSTTFNLPNLKGKVTIGQDTTDSDFNTIGKTGGEKEHILNVYEMPAHNHNLNAFTSGSGSTGRFTGTYEWSSTSSDTEGTRWIGDTVYAGGGQAHNNIPPYIVSNYIIKANHTSYVGEESVVQTSYSTSTTDTYSCNYINSIIESGSNANGSWIKWADGTMIVLQEYFDTKNIYVTMGSLKRVGLNAPPDFPQEFKEPPIVQITLQHAWLAWLMGIEGNATTTNATGKELIPIASVEQKTLTDVKIHILAIGKWK